MYHVYGNSGRLSVSATTPCGEAPAWPSAGAGGAGGGAGGAGAGVRGAGAGVRGAGAGVGVRTLATVGSSLSLGRGSPGARGDAPWSGRLAGRSRVGRSREGSREGRSVGVGRGGGRSSRRGGSAGLPCGAPTAATAGTRLTMTGLGWLPPHTALPESTARTRAA